MSEREYDVILFGATGFTGELTAYALSTYLPGRTLRWALAGRNHAKLLRVQSKVPARESGSSAAVDVLVADALDPEQMRQLAARTKVICNAAGPYTHYGTLLVDACAAAGTHYCDLSAEVPWIQGNIERLHERARSTGARIVHACGFDSIPSDLGNDFLQREARARFGKVLPQVEFFLWKTKGGFSGGTVASLSLIVDALHDPEQRKLLEDPYGFAHGSYRGKDGVGQNRARHVEGVGWTAPFLMAPINERVVRRSASLTDALVSTEFRYSEAMRRGHGAWGRASAMGLSAFIKLLAAGLYSPLSRAAVRKFLPKPSEGPSAKDREEGFYEVRLRGRDAEGNELWVRGRGTRDPGYGSTAHLLAYSSLLLARDEREVEGGVLTPATAFGEPFLLAPHCSFESCAGIEFDVME